MINGFFRLVLYVIFCAIREVVVDVGSGLFEIGRGVWGKLFFSGVLVFLGKVGGGFRFSFKVLWFCLYREIMFGSWEGKVLGVGRVRGRFVFFVVVL